jgi:hypothetical protein
MFLTSSGRAHFLCLASSTVAAAGMRLEDLKWLLSLLVSIFGTLAGIWMFRRQQQSEAERSARWEAAWRSTPPAPAVPPPGSHRPITDQERA